MTGLLRIEFGVVKRRVGDPVIKLMLAHISGLCEGLDFKSHP